MDKEKSPDSVNDNTYDDIANDDLEGELYARNVEIKNFEDLEKQRGTPIPALFNQFYKFIQNPSSVSVETFKRMVDTDDTTGSGVDFLTTCLAARLGAYQHKSPEITEWVNNALDKMDGGFHNAIKSVLSASWAGFSVSEKVWSNDQQMGWIIKKLVTLPPSTILFSTERTGELEDDGILQYQRNFNPAQMGVGGSYLFGFLSSIALPTQGQGRNDPYAKFGDLAFPIRVGTTYNYLAVRIPKLKCVHYAFDAQGKFGNPYGRSLLRRAYKYYVMKDAFLQMLATALDRKGTPLTVVFADPNMTVLDQTKTQGTDAQGKRGVGMRGDQAALKAFGNVHNDTVIVLPGKKDQHFSLEKLDVQSNAADFISALDFCNKSIMRALLLPSLIFTSGDGAGSFALGQEHSKTFDKILDSMNAGLTQTLLQQVIHEMLVYNFPKSAWEKDGLGSFGKRQLTNEEKEKEMSCFETGINAGIIDGNDLNDLNKMREAMGFEPRDKIIEKPDPLGLEEDGTGDETDPAKKSAGGKDGGDDDGV